jgi:hypothetical protein
MSGRKCHECLESMVGSCPFNYACKIEVWERFNKFPNKGQNVSPLSSFGSACSGEEKSHEKHFR